MAMGLIKITFLEVILGKLFNYIIKLFICIINHNLETSVMFKKLQNNYK